MKLQTSIPPRRDGTVKVNGQDRQTYVFVADDSGDLTCDVTDEATVAQLLDSKMFWPADPAEMDKALTLIKKPTADASNDQDDGGDGNDDGPDDDPVDLTALPIEANTPPVPAARKTAAKAGAKATAKPAVKATAKGK